MFTLKLMRKQIERSDIIFLIYYSTISVSSSAVYQNLEAWAVLAWAVGPCCSPRAEWQQHKKLRYLCCRYWIFEHNLRFSNSVSASLEVLKKIIKKIWGNVFLSVSCMTHNYLINYLKLSILRTLGARAQYNAAAAWPAQVSTSFFVYFCMFLYKVSKYYN